MQNESKKFEFSKNLHWNKMNFGTEKVTLFKKPWINNTRRVKHDNDTAG